jgi:hypothetical protein
VLDMHRQTQLPHRDERLLVDVCGPGEWVVRPSACGRSLHVYRLARTDWLVSEVGRDNEGRGNDLEQALAALAVGVRSPGWWKAVAKSLNGGEPESVDSRLAGP